MARTQAEAVPTATIMLDRRCLLIYVIHINLCIHRVTHMSQGISSFRTALAVSHSSYTCAFTSYLLRCKPRGICAGRHPAPPNPPSNHPKRADFATPLLAVTAHKTANHVIGRP